MLVFLRIQNTVGTYSLLQVNPFSHSIGVEDRVKGSVQLQQETHQNWSKKVQPPGSIANIKTGQTLSVHLRTC